LPEKIRKKQFTAEERLRFESLEDTIISDSTDEATYKPKRQASRSISAINMSPLAMSSMSLAVPMSEQSEERPSTATRHLVESFRWMDEEEDMDIKLVLDDYHANLDGVVIPSPTSTVRPSYRRNISISKVPFSRPTVQSSDGDRPIVNKHMRQKSRALSLIIPRGLPDEHAVQIDPHAAYYQDPDARLKLRAYLASPQKFDEAIEFGFPSQDGRDSGPLAKANGPLIKVTGYKAPEESNTQATFFNDGGDLLDDDVSVADPESPPTPRDADSGFNMSHTRLMSLPDAKAMYTDFSQLPVKKPFARKHHDSYAQSSATHREMTLRMTLTRPDLRTNDDLIYGGQAAKIHDGTLSALETGVLDNQFMRGPFDGPDGWGTGQPDVGVVKRLWNRVVSHQKKAAV
jgi:hypothetical protein